MLICFYEAALSHSVINIIYEMAVTILTVASTL